MHFPFRCACLTEGVVVATLDFPCLGCMQITSFLNPCVLQLRDTSILYSCCSFISQSQLSVYNSISLIPIAAMVVDIVEVYGPGMSFYLPGSKGKVAPPTTTAEEKPPPIEVSCQQATVSSSGMSDLLIRRALSRDIRKLYWRYAPAT